MAVPILKRMGTRGAGNNPSFVAPSRGRYRVTGWSAYAFFGNNVTSRGSWSPLVTSRSAPSAPFHAAGIEDESRPIVRKNRNSATLETKNR